MRAPRPGHHRRGRSARRPAERSRRRADRRQDRLRRCAVRRRPRRDRGLGLRLAEVGAADGGRRRGVRGHRPARRACATPRWCRTWRASARARGRRRHARSPSSRPRPRRSAAQHQPDHRRVAGHLSRRVCDAALAAGMRVRGYLSTASAVRSKGHVAPARVAEVAARLLRPRRVRGGDQRHDRRRAPRSGGARCSTRSPRACRWRRWRCTCTTRAARRSPTSWRGCSTASPRSTRRRRAGRLPVRAGRLRQPGHRGPALHAGRDGDRDRRVARRSGRGLARARPGHRPPAAVEVSAGRPGLRAWGLRARGPEGLGA